MDRPKNSLPTTGSSRSEARLVEPQTQPGDSRLAIKHHQENSSDEAITIREMSWMAACLGGTGPWTGTTQLILDITGYFAP